MSPYSRAAVVLAAVLALQLVRCGDDHGHHHPANLPDVIYEGTASDEALEVVWPRLPEAQADGDLRLLAPEDDVPASPPPEIRWSGEEASLPPGIEPWPLPFGPAVAAAHLPPVTGMVYLIELEGADTLRIFTDRTSFTPGEADWARLHGGGARTIEVRLYRAYLEKNAVTEGPFRGADGTIRVLAP